MSTILKTESLSKKYHLGTIEIDALMDIALAVEKGEFVAVMGASGSGKSTLLHMLGGLDTPTEGKIILEEKDLSAMSDKKLSLLRRKEIGFIFQFFNLIPTLSAEENIALPLLIDGKKPKEFQAPVDDMLKLVGLVQRKDHKPNELSGGESQRVAIGRALVTKPAIALADEPTGNLDSKTGEEILKLLRKSCDDLNQTIIMVTHDPKAAAYSDRVIFLKDGKIIAQLKVGKEIDPTPVINKIKELNL